MKNGDVKIDYQSRVYPGKYLATFVHWCTHYEEEIDGFQYRLWFQILDEQGEFGGKDDKIFILYEVFGNEKEDELFNGVYPEFSQALHQLNRGWKAEPTTEKILDNALGKIYLVTVSQAPRNGEFWQGVSKVERPPLVIKQTEGQGL